MIRTTLGCRRMRGLDVWLEQHLFGAKKRMVRACDTKKRVAVYGYSMPDDSTHELDLRHAFGPPAYSSDINAAFRVLDRLKAECVQGQYTGKGFLYDIEGYLDGTVLVRFRDPVSGACVARDTAHSLPSAICLAAQGVVRKCPKEKW